MKSICWRSYMD